MRAYVRWKFKLCWNQLLSFVKLFLVICFILGLIFTICNVPHKTSTHHSSEWIRRNNNVSTFLQSATYEGNNLLCDDTTKVLVAIVSSPSHILARNAIRHSWAQNFPLTWKTVFFVGKASSEETEENINKELQSKNDIIQSEFVDSYQNLTLKVLLLLKWVNENCKQAKLFMKVDDDVYVNAENMQGLFHCCLYVLENTYTTNIPEYCSEWHCSDKAGHFIDTNTGEYKSYMAAGYLYKGIKPDRNPSSKWHLDPSIYSYNTLPETLSGTSYILSTNLLPYILDAATNIPIINLEDVYITGIILSNFLKLKLSHLTGWSNFRPQWDDLCLYKTLLTVHGLSSEELLNTTIAVNHLTSNDCGWFRQSLSYLNKLISYYIPRYKN